MQRLCCNKIVVCNIIMQHNCSHNSVWKTELDGFLRKAARRVEVMDDRKSQFGMENRIQVFAAILLWANLRS